MTFNSFPALQWPWPCWSLELCCCGDTGIWRTPTPSTSTIQCTRRPQRTRYTSAGTALTATFTLRYLHFDATSSSIIRCCLMLSIGSIVAALLIPCYCFSHRGKCCAWTTWMLHDPKMKKTLALFDVMFFLMWTWSNKGHFYFYCCCLTDPPPSLPQWPHFVAYVSDLSTVPSKTEESTEKKERKEKKRSLNLLHEKMEHKYRNPFSQTTKWFQNEGLMHGFRRWRSWSLSLDPFEARWKLWRCRCILFLPPTHRLSTLIT